MSLSSLNTWPAAKPTQFWNPEQSSQTDLLGWLRLALESTVLNRFKVLTNLGPRIKFKQNGRWLNKTSPPLVICPCGAGRSSQSRTGADKQTLLTPSTPTGVETSPISKTKATLAKECGSMASPLKPNRTQPPHLRLLLLTSRRSESDVQPTRLIAGLSVPVVKLTALRDLSTSTRRIRAITKTPWKQAVAQCDIGQMCSNMRHQMEIRITLSNRAWLRGPRTTMHKACPHRGRCFLSQSSWV
jgi:hypothetical protein